MLNYFKLQFNRFTRRFKDAGIHPILACFVLLAGFIGLSLYLFHKTSTANYLYAIVALSFCFSLSEAKRNDFLKSTFSTPQWRKIRVLENLIVAFPFVCFMMYKQQFLIAGILVFTSSVISFLHSKTSFNFTIPTPFFKKPFEFTVGFRSTFYLFPMAYALACFSTSTNNYNLGVFSLLAVFAICLNYFTKPEDEFFVWAFNQTPKQFLFEKMKIALWYSTLLTAPIALMLGILFFENVLYTLLFLVIGYAFLMAAITAKYSTFPDEMNLMQGFLITMSFFFPPLLLVVIPYFFSQSITRLKPYLK